ncbi:hypothetical protein B0H13DRAFT_1618168 [Mycena leptocephala]|nr:hypothetical protein B0H13DRAFT_1618168 [Mycena leptocephala]
MNTVPNSIATHHLVFDTVGSGPQHWPNAIYQSGHTIVPGTIPTGTLLYYGRLTRMFQMHGNGCQATVNLL